MSNSNRILVIDDNIAVYTALKILLSLDGWSVEHAVTPELGLARARSGHIALVIQDMNYSTDTTSGAEGVALFHQLRELRADLPVILLTAWTQLPTAVELIKAGAADYLGKPWDDTRLRASVRNLLELAEANERVKVMQQRQRASAVALQNDFDLCGLVFADPLMESVVRLTCQVARSDVPLLITGPNGTGKDRLAAIIQANSRVKSGPFVQLNCGALPSELIEAELFGAEAGAFTGAQKAREGRFETADGGTLFLDEIGNLSPAGQMKLLRVLETGRFERLGSSRTREVKVRVISATNADLRALISTGQFREDLFYRLNVIELRIPPLKARPDDILPIAQSFLSDGKRLSSAAREALLAHSWPGNVRELRNALTRACLLAPGLQIDTEHLGLPDPAGTSSNLDPREPTRAELQAALDAAHGVISDAAARLGLSRQALYRRMERFGIAKVGAGS